MSNGQMVLALISAVAFMLAYAIAGGAGFGFRAKVKR